MSVQFGKCNFDGKPLEPEDLTEVRPVIAPFGPDGEGYICKDNFAVLYRSFHTTKESRREATPHITASGGVLTWDGRLDNRRDLIEGLAGELSPDSTDLQIVAAAHERWGTAAFRELIGDWAISLWSPNDQSLILAKDFVGTRHLYYAIERNQVTWCTILDPLVLFARHRFKLEEEYVAGWLSFFPATHLTPYVGIQAVPPASFVRLIRGKQTVTKYWDFDPGKRIRYRAESEYEEHFRSVFAQSVRRRLRSDSPVLAELSGGMDSSSIVCMAGLIIAQQYSEAPGLDTISYYSNSEPNWNERPYFTSVENKLGRIGCHIDVDLQKSFSLDFDSNSFAATPNCTDKCASEAVKQFESWVISHRNRVLVSGIGGDEVTGGLPTAIPELEDLLARARFIQLASRLKLWALSRRKPWFHLLFEAARGFQPPEIGGVPPYMCPPSWLHRDFVKRHRRALTGYPLRVKLFGALPSFQENLSILEALRRQIACDALPSEPPYEKRYPYLDRDLLEFIFACPREQLVRPGQRRSLMRRSLVGIVPSELLNRKRKAFVVRSPLLALSTEQTRLSEMSEMMLVTSFGILDPEAFRLALRQACQGQEVAIVTLMRVLGIESWLRKCERNKILTGCPSTIMPGSAAGTEDRNETEPPACEIQPASS